MSSVKIRLIAHLEAELVELESRRVESEHKLWELRQRGSGPLPHWANMEARRRGVLEPDPEPAPWRSGLLGPRS